MLIRAYLNAWFYGLKCPRRSITTVFPGAAHFVTPLCCTLAIFPIANALQSTCTRVSSIVGVMLIISRSVVSTVWFIVRGHVYSSIAAAWIWRGTGGRCLWVHSTMCSAFFAFSADRWRVAVCYLHFRCCSVKFSRSNGLACCFWSIFACAVGIVAHCVLPLCSLISSEVNCHAPGTSCILLNYVVWV